MSTVFESLSLKGLRLAHLKQLLGYLEDRDREGWYFKPKEQFEKRHEELRRWLESTIRYGENEGVRFPK